MENKPSCEIITRLPSEQEKRLFGVFLSHSNKDLERVRALVRYMEDSGLFPIYDKGFLNGGDDYLIRIQDCIKCYAGVVVITKNALESDWVSYECGYFRTLNMPVYLWDPDDLLSLEQEKFDDDVLNTHITQYLPTLHSMEELVEKLKENSIYSDIYTHDCREVPREQFHQMLHKHVSTVMLRITDKRLAKVSELLRGCKLGTLVVNFGMFYEEQGDGVHCWAQRSKNAAGVYTVDEAPVLAGGRCGVSGLKCALYSDERVYADKQDCIILNHIIFNGRYFAAGEKDYDDNTHMDKGVLSFYVPVHRLYGTEFKFIIDAPNNEKHHRLLRLFQELGLEPTVSDSLNGWRIYLSLPDAPAEGLFRLTKAYGNNFLCPRAAVEPLERETAGW